MAEITPDVYSHREEILKQGTPEQKAKFRELIAAYESKQSVPLSVSIAAFREKHPEEQRGAGANVLESEGHQAPVEPTAGDPVNSGFRQKDWGALQKLSKPKEAGLGEAPEQGGQDFTQFIPPGEDAGPLTGATHDIDEALPNASKLRKYQEPPELVGNNQVAPDYFYEPTDAEFQQTMGPILKVRGITSMSDPRYHALKAEYADKQYAGYYEMAKREGRSLVRPEYVLKDGISAGSLIDYLKGKGRSKTLSFLGGLSTGFAPGSTGLAIQALGGDLDTYARMKEDAPIANVAGTVAGSVSPYSLPAKEAGAITRLIGTESGASRILGGFGAGAIVGGGSSALPVLTEGGSTDDVINSGLQGAMIGGPLGAAGQTVAELATGDRNDLGFRKWLRGPTSPLYPELGNFEASGGATTLGRGLRAPQETLDALEAARAPVPGENKVMFPGNPVEVRAEAVRGPLSLANKTAIDTEIASQQQQSGEFINRYLRGKTAPLRNTLSEAIEMLKRRSNETPNVIPGTAEHLPAIDNQKLARVAQDSMTPELVPVSQAQATMAARGGIRVLDVDEAQRLGFQLEPMLRGIHPDDPRSLLLGPTEGPKPSEYTGGARELDLSSTPSNGDSARKSIKDAFRVVLVPKELDPARMDEVIRQLDDNAKEINPDPMWDRLRAVAREDRKMFGPEWENLKAQQHERMLSLEQRAGHAGLRSTNPQEFSKLPPNEQQRFNANLLSTGQGPADSTKALQSLADAAGGTVPQDLRLLVGQRSYDALRSKAGTPILGLGPGGVYSRMGGLSTAAMTRLDALARIISRNPEGLSSVTYSDLGPELQAALSQGKPSAVEHTRPGALTNLFGLGGGGLGIRAAQGYSATGRELLSDDDIATLLAMIRGRQSGPQGAEAH